ncbi:MAG TPA: hypothetical protein VFO84_02430 [Dehalococcoidia bacterium]|nr:hypothetical protein [Dehalococcoidia bacterium]
MASFSTNGAAEESQPRPSIKAIVVLVIAVLFLIIGTAVSLAFLTPSGEEDVGNAIQYEFGSVTRFSSENYYLVRLENGDFLSLYDRDTDPEARRSGCRISWEPTEVVGESEGVFRGDCNESAWAIDGTLLRGPSPRDMDRLDVDVDDDGSVSVDTARLICGEGDVPRGGLNNQCLPFRDERSD